MVAGHGQGDAAEMAVLEGGAAAWERLLNGAAWDAQAVRDDLQAYVLEHLGDTASGVVIVDESGFPKMGTHSCGVAPHYCGTLGRSANAQVGVFPAYGSARGPLSSTGRSTCRGP